LSPNKDVEEFQESLHVHYHARHGPKYIEPGSLVEMDNVRRGSK
jgi:hypothetical protein